MGFVLFFGKLILNGCFYIFKRPGGKKALRETNETMTFSSDKMYHINKERHYNNSICNIENSKKKSLKQSENLKFTVEKRKGILETTITVSSKHLNQHIKPQLPSECTLSLNSAINVQ